MNPYWNSVPQIEGLSEPFHVTDLSSPIWRVDKTLVTKFSSPNWRGIITLAREKNQWPKLVVIHSWRLGLINPYWIRGHLELFKISHESLLSFVKLFPGQSLLNLSASNDSQIWTQNLTDFCWHFPVQILTVLMFTEWIWDALGIVNPCRTPFTGARKLFCNSLLSSHNS